MVVRLSTTVPRFRSFRGSRRPTMRPVIQSYKKVINHAPASLAAGVRNTLVASTGVDGVAAGQTSATDTNVPTGSIIKYIEFQISLNNIVENPAFAHVTIQLKHSGQTTLDPDVVGGNSLRNNIYHQDLFAVAQNQNVNRTYKFKVPKRVQRIRETDIWQIAIKCNQASSQVGQFIYKFYR